MPKLYYDTAFWHQWPVTLGISSKGLKLLEFRSEEQLLQKGSHKPDEQWIHDPAALEPYMKQVMAYFRGERHTFDLNLDLQGTDFQMRIWDFLLSIPYGKVASYQATATAAGNSKAVRAAGMANNRNPVSVVVPCHRVVGKNGTLTGYGGGLDLKESLLKLEGIQVFNGRIREDASWMNSKS